LPSTIAEELPDLEELINEAETDIGQAIKSVARLQARGITALERVGIQVGFAGKVLGWAGKANAGVSSAAEAMQGVRSSVHEAIDRLQQGVLPLGGGGGKVPPP
jgi:hypothetical protein